MIHFPDSITTDRLIIRRWRATDAAQLWEAVNESRERLAVYLPWTAHYDHAGSASEYIERAANAYSGGKELPLCIEERATGRLVGGSGFHSDETTADGWRMLEIGYWLREGDEGKGYMREAVRAQTRLAFELGVERLQILCDDRNRHSYRVAESCGFRHEVTLRRDSRSHQGDLRDTRIYAMVPEEARALMTEWASDCYQLEWPDSPDARPSPESASTNQQHDLPELPVVLTSLIRLDPAKLHEPGFHYTIVDAAGHRHIGIATIVPLHTDVPSFGLKWSFRTPDEPFELGVELGLALLKIAFEELAAERVELRTPLASESGLELADVLGFVNEGSLRAHRSPIDGVIGDFAVSSVIRSDL